MVFPLSLDDTLATFGQPSSHLLPQSGLTGGLLARTGHQPDLVRLVEAERDPVDHHRQGSWFMAGRPCDASTLAKEKQRLVVQLAGDLKGGGHLPPGVLEAGQQGTNESPAGDRLLSLGSPRRTSQLVLVASVIAPHCLDSTRPRLLDDPGHLVQYFWRS